MDKKPVLTACDAHNADEHGQTLLHFSAFYGYIFLTKYLLQVMLADPNATNVQRKETPLHLAVKRGHLGAVKVLLKFSATINTSIEDIDHKTPYDYAVEDAINSKDYRIVHAFHSHENHQPISKRELKLSNVF